MSNAMIFAPPGLKVLMSRQNIRAMLNIGGQLRGFYWQYPLLPEAVYIFQQIACSREYQMIARSARAAARAMEWLQSAETLNTDGTTTIGFEDLIKRRAVDYLMIGRTIMVHRKNKPLRYVDPVDTLWDMEERRWVNFEFDEKYTVKEVTVNHPIPIGYSGLFMSPIYPIMPKAILAWLIDQHDTASADGRKVRDIYVCISEELHTMLQEAIADTVANWAGAKPDELGVQVVYAEGLQGMDASQLIARVGLANIPDNFDRAQFEWSYANAVANATGLPLRQIWNSERATNRALEEVQETRAIQKGPASFIHTEQNLINASKALEQFGPGTRLSFVEERDLQSRKTNAEVMKMYIEAAVQLAALPGGEGRISVDAIVNWLKSEFILPPDLELLGDVQRVLSEPQVNSEGAQVTTTDDVTPELQKNASIPDYGEFVVDSKGVVMEKRLKVYSLDKHIRRELAGDSIRTTRRADLNAALRLARSRRVDRYYRTQWDEHAGDPDLKAIRDGLPEEEPDTLTEEQHGLVLEALRWLDGEKTPTSNGSATEN